MLVFFAPRRLISVERSEEVLLSAGVDRGFEELFVEHYPRLVRTLLRLLGDPAQAEEIAADTFYKLYQRRGGPEAAGNAAGWLYRTAWNLGLDALRSNARRSRREEQAGRQALLNTTSGSPLQELLAEEERRRVRAIVACLKPIQGQVLLMVSSGFSCKEMAGILGLKPDSLYVLISRARAAFEKQYLRAYGKQERGSQ